MNGKAASLIAILCIAGCAPAGDEGQDAPAAGTPADEAAAPATSEILETMPEAFRGQWDFDEAGCADPASEMRLAIEADSVRFYESVAAPISIVGNGPDSLTVDHRFSGEGEEWTETLAYELSEDGDRLTVTTTDGSLSIRIRCE